MAKVRLVSQIVFLALLLRLVLGLGGGDFERWCPFGGIETTYLFFFHDTFSCTLGSSNLYMALGVIVLTLIARRSFCSYICPIGAISEWVGKIRDRFFRGRRLQVPEAADRWLRKIKYPLVALILYFTFYERELIFRAFDPFYALCSKHGEDITFWAYVVLSGTLVGAVFLFLPFCRYLCPFAAVLNPFSRFGLLRIVRSEEACVSCGRCDTHCEAGIPVSQLVEVNAARCTACLECVDSCPVEGSLYLGMPLGRGKAQAEPKEAGA